MYREEQMEVLATPIEGENNTCDTSAMLQADQASGCLVRALFMWAPSVFFWVIIPFYLCRLSSRCKTSNQGGNITQFKMSITVLLAALTFVESSKRVHDCEWLTKAQSEYHLDWTQLSTLVMAAIVMKLESDWSQEHASPLWAYWLLMLIPSGMTLYSGVTQELYRTDYGGFAVGLASLLGVVAQLVLSNISWKKGEEKKDVHPQDNASFFSFLFWDWMIGIMKKGGNLEEEDCPKVSNEDQCQSIYPVFEHAWKQEEFSCEQWKEIHRQKQGNHKSSEISNGKVNGKSEGKSEEDSERKSSLLYAMLRAFGMRYFISQFAHCFLDLCNFIDPFLLEALMLYIQHRESGSMERGISIVMAMFLVIALREIGHHHAGCYSERLRRHMNATLRMAVYRKALSAGSESRKGKTSGEIVSLMGEDTDRFIGHSRIGFLVVLTPIQVTFALYMLYSQLGMAAFVGLAIMLTLIPLNSWVGRKIQKLEKEKNEVKDERVKVMNEILNGMKVLKLYAWEKSFMHKIFKIRDKEVNINRWISVCRACIDLMFRAIPFLVRFTAFIIFITLGGYLDPAKAFVVGSLFDILNGPFSLMALVIPGFAEAAVSMKRINDFLNNKDIPEDIVSRKSEADAAISIKNGTFTWDTAGEKSTLENINLKVPQGKLVAIVGTVGSGKSSLLSAVMGEMEKVEGKVTVQGSVGYVAQEAWIQNATLKNNVLFGSKLNSQKYCKVIRACALKDDFKILTAGDKTEIGEKGINLSGGQKQRVALARAVYNDADIYLFDDPLSAVDAHVDKHIFNKVIGHSGMLKSKTRLLVTHGVHWLPFVDNIIVLKDGLISESGTYRELISHDGAFAQFLKDVFEKESKDDDGEVQKVRKTIFTRLKSLNEAEPEPLNDSDDETACTIDKQLLSSSSGSDSEENVTTNKQNEVDSDEEDDEIDIKHEDDKDDETKGKIIDEEESKQGSVSMEVYKEYGKAVGVKYIVLFTLIFAILLCSREFKTIWLGKWTEDHILANTSLVDTEEYQSTLHYYISVFGLSGAVEVVMAFVFIIEVQKRTFEAANQLHRHLLTNILQSPMSFFDTTPSGRIITRFSKDIGCVDGLGECLAVYIRSLGNLLISLLLVIVLTPFLIPLMILVAAINIFMQCFSVGSIRQLRRFRSKHTSPMFEHFKETLHGTTTVRAFKAQDRFISQMEHAIDSYNNFHLMNMYLSLWFSLKLMIVSSLVVLGAGLMVVWDTSISPSLAGIILCCSERFIHCFRWFVFHASHTEQELVSLERVIEYSNKPTEAPWELSESSPDCEWPQNGEIVLDDYQLRYREGLDLVLKGVSCNIKHGEKIGVVGRTGAGKSSLTLALFRLVEAAAGQISVDGLHIAKLGLHDLRKKITILPQDPVIFGGSLRMNLDPFGEKSDEEIWEALQHSHLKSFVDSLPEKLDYDCGEGGKNLSVGQRQLVCLARTLLRKTKILVLDEATAAVDMETDELIQKTICNEFSDCTVLTIAHRLNTIMDYDRILVLDNGTIKEFDTPKNLLADTNSAFYGMAKDAKLV